MFSLDLFSLHRYPQLPAFRHLATRVVFLSSALSCMCRLQPAFSRVRESLTVGDCEQRSKVVPRFAVRHGSTTHIINRCGTHFRGFDSLCHFGLGIRGPQRRKQAESSAQQRCESLRCFLQGLCGVRKQWPGGRSGKAA